ncbi:PAS domain S-box protein [Argonema antarcticum]|uniref:PAS domain S-box protein n=1 Tax=Argonema antarcticum TaxID=2942763 RepID=UPI0020138F13|nr:PAS domain S-box protein [Argonema antarcticum]MCL1472469.1 PAS domain S-box protein [Argonema antarcticum A004/B2]
MKIHHPKTGYGIGVLAVALALMVLWPGVLKNLLVAKDFIPHGHCYLWKPALVSLHVTADLLIGGAYIAISATLAYLVYKSHQDIPFHWMFLLFGTFIIACGSTHLMEVWTLWTPTYWLSGELKLMTAVVSVTTATVLPSLVPQVLTLVEVAKISQERKLKLETANLELETVAHQLQELDRIKSQFFANVSHELRTPLALILGPTEKLLASEQLPQEHRHDLQVVRRNAQTLLKQVNDLLDVSKLEAGKMSVNYAQVDLAELVRLTAAHFETLAEDLHISFAVEGPQSLPAQVDPEKLQRICFNLLSNAFKFTPNGGTIGCILQIQREAGESAELESGRTGERENGRTGENVHHNSPTPPLPHSPTPPLPHSPTPPLPLRVTIIVEDSGPGVPPELREVIFEPFRQEERGISRNFGSTGLGLAIVKEFIELHGGTIAVEDSALGGAKFTVELPLLAPAGVTLQTPIDKENINNELARQTLAELQVEEITDRDDFCPLPLSPSSESPLILVVEDNPEMNRFITQTLTPEYRTVTAFNGRTALELAIELRPDLILTDVMMPEMSGEELVWEIRLRPELDVVPIVLLTAKADDELRVQLLREVAQDYVMKPFSVEELKARVGNLIAMKRAREILQQELGSATENLAVLAKEVQIRQQELQTTLLFLQESEQRFRQLAEHIHEIFWLFEPENVQILYISPAYEQIWGRTCQSLYSRPRSFLDAIHPDDREFVQSLTARHIQGDRTETEYRILQPDGTLRWIWDRAFPIKDESGKVDRIAGIAEDITDRKQAEAALQKFASELEILVAQRTAALAEANTLLQEKITELEIEKEALRQSEQRFRSYFELPLIGIAITSLEKNWLQVNDKLCDIFGYSRQELSEMTWVDLTHPDDLAADIEYFNLILTGKSESYSMDKRFIRKDGGVINATIALQCVRRADRSIDYFVVLVQDITDRVQAFERLRLLESVVVNANDAVIITEAEPIEESGPRIIYVNDAFTRMTGYTQQEVLGKTPRILQGPKSDRTALNKLRTALQNWQPSVVELINYRKDGSQFWVELSVVPVADETGWYTHWIAIQRDITDRKLSEEVLHRRKQQFKTLVENTPDIIIRCDKEMRYLYANPIVEKLTGTPIQNSIGKTFREMGTPEDLCLLWERTLYQVFESGIQQTIEFESPTVLGLRAYQSRLVPELNKEGAIESALIVIRDITELKQAEEERAQLIREQAARVLAEDQQRRFAFLAQASMVLASSLDYETTLAQLARLSVPYLADWCIVYIIKEDGEIGRLAVAHRDSTQEKLLLQLQSNSGLDSDRSHPVVEVLRTGKPAFYPEIPDVILQESAIDPEQLQLFDALKPRSVTIVPLVTQGRILGALGFAFGESGRYYTSEDLTLAEELANRAALAVDNSRTHLEAQEANRLKDEFLAILSHELRTPLHAILGWVSLLRAGKVNATMTERALETIERNARLQTEMVSDLLDVSRIIRGQLQLDLCPIDPIPVIMAALDTVRPTAEAKGIVLNYDLNPVGQIAGDSDRLQQIVWNLLSNAIKFTPKGGRVEIRLELGNGEWGMGNGKELPIANAQITVTDTGKGISPKFMPFVFDRFRQENTSSKQNANSTLTRSQTGLGLGLAIVRNLVELHGGTVIAYSSGEGQGATFTVKLPLLEKAKN